MLPPLVIVTNYKGETVRSTSFQSEPKLHREELAPINRRLALTLCAKVRAQLGHGIRIATEEELGQFEQCQVCAARAAAMSGDVS